MTMPPPPTRERELEVREPAKRAAKEHAAVEAPVREKPAPKKEKEHVAPRETPQRESAPREAAPREAAPRAAPAKRTSSSSSGFTKIQVSWGVQGGADPRRLLAIACRKGDIESQNVGALELGENSSTLELRNDLVAHFLEAAGRPDKRDPKIRFRLAPSAKVDAVATPPRAAAKSKDGPSKKPAAKHKPLDLRAGKPNKSPRPER